MAEPIRNRLLNIPNRIKEKLTFREYIVLLERNWYKESKPYTLDAIGKRLDGGLTRERIRQIEEEATNKCLVGFPALWLSLPFKVSMDDAFKAKYPDVFPELSENQSICIPFEEMEKIFGVDEFYKALAFYLVYSKKYNSKTGISTKYRFVYRPMELSEEQALKMELKKYGYVISDEKYSNSDIFHKRLIKKLYRKSDGGYILRKVTKQSIITSLIEEYFPDGYHLADNEFFEKFKEAFKEKYGCECFFKKRDISVAISISNYCLIDRGVWKNFDFVNHIPQNLLEDIIEFVVVHGDSIYYSTVYDKYKNELIDNHFYFKGVFDKQTGAMFYQRRDTLSFGNSKKYDDPIKRYMGAHNGPFTLNELRERFPGVNTTVFTQKIDDNDDYILIDKTTFIDINFLHIAQEDVDEITEFVEKQFISSGEPSLSSRDLYPLFEKGHPELCDRLTYINNQTAFFSICSYYLKEKYKFDRPKISKE